MSEVIEGVSIGLSVQSGKVSTYAHAHEFCNVHSCIHPPPSQCPVEQFETHTTTSEAELHSSNRPSAIGGMADMSSS